MTPAEAKVVAQVAKLKAHAMRGPWLQLADQARRSAENIAAAMTALHGGEWKVRIDHDSQMVVVRRRFPL